jgi:Flp pilus assembly protein CpaB
VSNRTVLIAAIVLGALAALMNMVYISSAQPTAVTVLKVKPGQKLRAGQVVTSDMFDPVTVYGDDIGQLSRIAVPESELGSFKDQPILEVLEPGDILLQRAFRLQGDSGVRDQVGPGERALSVAVGAASSVNYFVRPGDVVDVWGQIASRTLLLKDHARVGAVGETYRLASEGSKEGYSTVTLIVSAKDVEGLVNNIGLAGGKVTLALVGSEDAGSPSGPALEPMIAPTEAPAPGGAAPAARGTAAVNRPAPAAARPAAARPVAPGTGN